MALEQDLLSLEEAFWRGDANFYRRSLTDNCLMVFAEPVGVLNKDQAVETIASSQCWADIRFESTHVVPLNDNTALVTYKATARREGDPSPYVTLASSVYVKRKSAQDGAWKLAFHQQTPSQST